jgi:hypothetical protein
VFYDTFPEIDYCIEAVLLLRWPGHPEPEILCLGLPFLSLDECWYLRPDVTFYKFIKVNYLDSKRKKEHACNFFGRSINPTLHFCCEFSSIFK